MATFGYTTSGASFTSGAGIINGSKFTLSEPAWITSMTVKTYDNFGGNSFYGGCAIYTTGGNLIAQTKTMVQTVVTFEDAWHTAVFLNPVLLGPDDYVLVVALRPAFTRNIRYDTGGTNQGYTASYSYFGNFPSSVSFTNNNNQFSIYATYDTPPPTTSWLSA